MYPPFGRDGKKLFAQSGKLLRNISKVSGAKFHVGVKASLNLGNYKDQIVGFRQKPDLAPIAPVIRVAGQAVQQINHRIAVGRL